jgi:stress response protein YsnF
LLKDLEYSAWNGHWMSSAQSPGRPEAIAVTRSAERQSAGIVNVVVGRARLVTFVVTEEKTFTVPVRRREVRLVYDPVPAKDQPVTSMQPVEETHEVILLSEQVRFTTDVVPVERVRMVRRVVRTEQIVTDQIRSEQIDVEQIEQPEGDTSWD